MFTHIKKSEEWSAEYYQDNKERQKKAHERYQAFSRTKWEIATIWSGTTQKSKEQLVKYREKYPKMKKQRLTTIIRN